MSSKFNQQSTNFQSFSYSVNSLVPAFYTVESPGESLVNVASRKRRVFDNKSSSHNKQLWMRRSLRRVL